MRQLMNLLDLNGDWTLHYGLQKTAACALDHPAIPDSFATCPARVPGNVELDLVRAGVLPQNLDHGANIYTLLDYEEHQWWLTRTFEIPSLASYPDPILSLHGIDTLATVWLNDRLVGRTENMLIPHVLDIEGALCEGTNRLTIALDSPVLAALEYRVNDCNRLCGAAAMSRQRSGFWCCERAQHQNRIHMLGSDPPFAATGTKVGLGPITTHVHTNYC